MNSARLRLGLWFFPFLLACALRGEEISLVRVGESWRYFCGTNEASSPVTDWRQLNFDDSTWREGPSGFSKQSLDEATVLTDGAPSRSFFFRRKFAVTNLPAIKWLVLRADYDDGFVAYLNGLEIARRGLTNEPVAFDDYATNSHPQDAAEDIDVSAFVSALTAGTNILAIQLHNSSSNSPTLALVPELLANFQRGPFVQNDTANSVQVIWRTPVGAGSLVEYGTNLSLGNAITNSSVETNHVITLTNLLPGTQYYYQARSTTGAVSAVSPVASFRTLKAGGELCFAVFGDSGSGSTAQYRVAELLENSGAELVLHTGDIIYEQFKLGNVDTKCLSVHGRHMRSTPYYFTMGNHELSAEGPSQVPDEVPYLESFYLPTNTMSGTEHYYSFDHGDAHFVCLWVPTLAFDANTNFSQYSLMTNGSAQFQWLTNDLAASAKPWKFLFFHSPVKGSGLHFTDDENGNNISDRLELQQLLLPVARRYGVQLIFNGHDHDYERFNPTNGTCVVVTGGGGNGANPFFVRDGGSAQFYSRIHYTRVTIANDLLLLEAIGTNGTAFDSMTFQRALPAPQTYEASNHTSVVESSAANDGDGNINGQTFDFLGPPIPTIPGDYSNLGRVYVNHDFTNLYVGFEQTMIHENNNIFLFIQSPRLAGVTNLVGLGNGLIDPDLEGVDGLDFLENLSFTNFTPGVAAILGDEFGDGQLRSFARTNRDVITGVWHTNLDVNIGQGVFRLDAGLSSVPGVRVQQFNRSPQVLLTNQFGNVLEGVRTEQNANFIEVAIPFNQLGGIVPGDIYKIAAIVGGPGFDTNQQTRELDTSFLGTSLSGSGQSNVVLGAVSVRVGVLLTVAVAPASTNAECGSNITFTASITGTPPVTLQWYDNLTNIISGATNITLTLSNVLTTQTGNCTLIATNPYGSSTSTVVALNISDTTAPNINLLGANPLNVECHASLNDPGATAADSCAGVLGVMTNSTVNTNVPGAYMVTYQANDGNGNTNSATRTVNVVDTLAPVITLNGANPLNVECHTSYSEPGATANDACAGSVSITASGAVDTNTPGSYTVTYKSDDGHGNTNSLTRTVNVIDTVAPVITYHFTNLVLSAGGTCTALMPDVTGTNYLVATDACSASVTITQTPTNNAPLALGTNLVILAAMDRASLVSYSTNTIVVTDTTAPVITLNGANPLTVECHLAFVDPGVTANDNCGVITVMTNSTVNTNLPGSYAIEYVAADAAGNSATNTRAVNVVDTIAPVITVLGANPLTNYATVPFTDPGATASDGCAGTVGVTTNGTVNTAIPGVYLLEYVSSDPGGNAATNTRTVYVVALVEPVITYWTMLTNGAFEVTFTGPDGQPHTLLTSTSVVQLLNSWSVLTTGAFGTNAVIYTDTSATNDRIRFYRVRSP